MDRQELAGREQLEHFGSTDFDVQISPMGSAESIRDLIRRTVEFRSAKQALEAGLITDRVIREFTSGLMRDFVPGKKFPNETALAALAVLCESHFAPFAEELLIDLAALRLPEIGHAIRVARACLQHRIRLPKTRSKTYIVQQGVWNAGGVFALVATAWRVRKPIKFQAYAVA